MSEANESPEPTEDAAKPPRREPTARPRKSPKVESTADSQESAPVENSQEDKSDSGDFSGDHDSGSWPEPDAASTGGNSGPSEAAKKKRRRRKGKGAISQAQGSAPQAEETFPISPEVKVQDHREPRPQPHGGSTPFPQRIKHDPEQLAKMAWKIYSSEVGEEGVALIGDNDAKELSRRCFRLAEIFLDEQARHR